MVVEILLLVQLFFGLTAMFWDDIKRGNLHLQESLHRWYDSLKFHDKEAKPAEIENFLYLHLEELLQLTMEIGTEKGVRLFLILSGCLGTLVTVLLAGRVAPLLALGAAVVTTCFPYGVLRLRLQKLRIYSSREGEVLLTELLDNYKIYYKNMRQAIDVSARGIENAPNAKKLLLSLSKGLNSAKGEREIRKAVNGFGLAIHTSWGDALALNMYFSLVFGLDITHMLEDLAQSMEKAREIAEYGKRENHEATLMLNYLAPISYGLTVLGGIGYFGLSFQEFFHYQFQTTMGLTWWIVSLLCYGIGIFVQGFLRNEKLDF